MGFAGGTQFFNKCNLWINIVTEDLQGGGNGWEPSHAPSEWSQHFLCVPSWPQKEYKTPAMITRISTSWANFQSGFKTTEWLQGALCLWAEGAPVPSMGRTQEAGPAKAAQDWVLLTFFQKKYLERNLELYISKVAFWYYHVISTSGKEIFARATLETFPFTTLALPCHFW